MRYACVFSLHPTMNASVNTMNVDEWAMRCARASVQQWDDGDACDRPAPELIDLRRRDRPRYGEVGGPISRMGGWGSRRGGRPETARLVSAATRDGCVNTSSRECGPLEAGWRGHVRGRALAKSRRQSKRADSLTRKARRRGGDIVLNFQ